MTTPQRPPRSAWLRGLAELLAPTRCLACRRRAALPWCAPCARTVVARVDGCPRCAGPRRAAHPCWPDDGPFVTTTAALDYRGAVAASVVTAKIAGGRAGWVPLGRLLAARVAHRPPDVDAVTWVTTPSRRTQARGVDHARVLAAAVAVELSLPLVVTVGARVARGGGDRFWAVRELAGANLLLVDDVLTTGATAGRVATVLQARGAGDLHLAVLARAGEHPLVASAGPDVTVRRSRKVRSARGDD